MEIRVTRCLACHCWQPQGVLLCPRCAGGSDAQIATRTELTLLRRLTGPEAL